MASYAESTEYIVTKLARFHIELGGIPPFIDGNNRTGYLLVLLELMKAGYQPIANTPAEVSVFAHEFNL